MRDSTLVFTNETLDGTELVVNFGIHSGREATQAEIDRLARRLLGGIESFAVVSEVRYGFDREAETAVHQVRVELPGGAADEDVILMVEAWAEDCIRERSLLD